MLRDGINISGVGILPARKLSQARCLFYQDPCSLFPVPCSLKQKNP
ncbi:MAG: hypothetical protein F6K26_49955 [Moorea sp. SIO2I5]|nr:hypothetical protein [Moorena sp. SIO2I5]